MDFWITNLSGLFDGYNFTKGPINIEVSDGKIINITKNKIIARPIAASAAATVKINNVNIWPVKSFIKIEKDLQEIDSMN